MTGIDRGRTEQVLYRTAICAFTHYPVKPAAEPGYQVDEDVTWCVAPLDGQLPESDLQMLRRAIRILITTPTADRRPFIAKLAALTDEE